MGSNSNIACLKSRVRVQRYFAANAGAAEALPNSQQSAFLYAFVLLHKRGACTKALIPVIPQNPFRRHDSRRSMEQPGDSLSVNLRRDASHRSRSKPLPLWLCLRPAQNRRIHYTEAVGGVKLAHDLCRSQDFQTDQPSIILGVQNHSARNSRRTPSARFRACRTDAGIFCYRVGNMRTVYTIVVRMIKQSIVRDKSHGGQSGRFGATPR